MASPARSSSRPTLAGRPTTSSRAAASSSSSSPRSARTGSMPRSAIRRATPSGSPRYESWRRSESAQADQLLELDQAAVPQEVARLGHGHGDDAAVGIVEPRGAVAAGPAVATRDGPLLVGFGDHPDAEAPAATAENRAGAGNLIGRQVVRRHQ